MTRVDDRCCSGSKGSKIIRGPFVIWWVFVVGLATWENRAGNKYLKQHVFPSKLSFPHWMKDSLLRASVSRVFFFSVRAFEDEGAPLASGLSWRKTLLSKPRAMQWWKLLEQTMVQKAWASLWMAFDGINLTGPCLFCSSQKHLEMHYFCSITYYIP